MHEQTEGRACALVCECVVEGVGAPRSRTRIMSTGVSIRGCFRSRKVPLNPGGISFYKSRHEILSRSGR